METCTTCGSAAPQLVRVFPGEQLAESLLFCPDCVEFGACALPFAAQRRRDRQALLHAALRSHCDLLKALREERDRSAALELRIGELTEALRARDGD